MRPHWEELCKLNIYVVIAQTSYMYVYLKLGDSCVELSTVKQLQAYIVQILQDQAFCAVILYHKKLVKKSF